MVSLSFFSIWKCCGHIEMWVEEASKSEGRAVGHVTRTELVADWAFSLIKDQSAFLLSKSRSNRSGLCPGTSNEMGGRVFFSFYNPFDMIGPPYPLCLGAGSTQERPVLWWYGRHGLSERPAPPLLIIIRERKPQPEPHSFCVRM